MCQQCKRLPAEYVWENYIEQLRVIDRTAIINLTNEPWRRAIKAQAQGHYNVAETSFQCSHCLSECVAQQMVRPEVAPLIIRTHQGTSGTASFAIFFIFNSYEDEGVSYIVSVPDCPTIEDVADFVEQVDVPAHTDIPTTDEIIHDQVSKIVQEAQRRGVSIKVVRPDV